MSRFTPVALLFLSLAAVSIAPGLSFAKEIDQFSDRLSQLENLTDSSAEIDAEMNRLLGKLGDRLNRSHPPGDFIEHSITQTLNIRKFEPTVASIFQGRLLSEFKTPFEYWVRDEADVLLYWVANRGIYGGEVDYDDMGLAWYVEIAPIIRLGNYLVGIDKLGHFLGQGWFYYKTDQDSKKANPDWSDEKRHQFVLKYGHDLETSYLGLAGSGVYSYADLAANYQGYQFYQNLFYGENPYFRLVRGKLKQVRSFSILEYVTDDWDEVINPSMPRSDRFYDKVAKFIQQTACSDFRASTLKFLNRTGKELKKEEFIWDGPHPSFKRLDLFKICN